MISQANLKRIRALAQKKQRYLSKQFIVEGEKLVGELLQSKLPYILIAATQDWMAKNNNQVANCEEITDEDLGKVSQLQQANKVLAVVDFLEFDAASIHAGQRVLALDNINDPGNLGTILRIADWFGFDAVLLSENCVDPYNSKAVQATMGAIFHVPFFQVESLELTLTQLKGQGKLLYTAEMNGENLKSATLQLPGILIMGSESHGVRPEISALADKKLFIEGYGKSESLNVGVATGILCQWFRQ